MKPLHAGSMNHRLAYQTRTQVIGELRTPVDTWTTQATYWAEVRTATGRELLNAQQMQATLSHVLTLRYPGFVPPAESRFVEGSAVYNVSHAFDPDGRKRELIAFTTRDPAETP